MESPRERWAPEGHPTLKTSLGRGCDITSRMPRHLYLGIDHV